MDYAIVKALHQVAVVLSIAGFIARGWGGLLGAGWVRSRLALRLPHVIDTVLLASALWLAWQLRLTPGNAPWLTAKIVGLIIYIALGVVALRPMLPLRLRVVAWFTALLTFAYIVAVAITKQPLAWWAGV